MPFTEADVGKKMVGGIAVEVPLAERQAIADEWNANETTKAASITAATVKQGRLIALRVLIANDTATTSNINEFLTLLDL